jgi:hypothetical protein
LRLPRWIGIARGTWWGLGGCPAGWVGFFSLGTRRAAADAGWQLELGAFFFSSSLMKSVFLNFDQLYIYKNINIYNT